MKSCSGDHCAMLAVLLLLLVTACVASSAVNSDGGIDDSSLRHLSKRQVQTIYHQPRDSTRNSGLDPFEERLLIILLGGCLAVVFSLSVLIVCCRTYRVDRNVKGGGGGGGGWGMQPMLMGHMQPGQSAAGRSVQYYPTGYQPSVPMDPAYLDPGRGGGVSVVGQQQNVDNTAYASLGGFESHAQRV